MYFLNYFLSSIKSNDIFNFFYLKIEKVCTLHLNTILFFGKIYIDEIENIIFNIHTLSYIIIK